jgi:hypothetical protein
MFSELRCRYRNFLMAILMISGDWLPPDELEVVGDHFSIGSGAFDSSSFFGTDDPGDRDGASVPAFGAPRGCFGLPKRSSPSAATSGASPPAKPTRSPPTNCTGNCQTCAWSFLCKGAIGGVGPGVRRLG